MNILSLSNWRSKTAAKTLLILGILLIAANLRAPITSLAPLLNPIRESFTLSAAAAGMLTTLPLLVFAAMSPFASLIAREYGTERTLFGALLLIAGGILLRSMDAVWCLYLGTCIIGIGIAIGNVLLPSLLKRDFPDRIATLTGAYSLSMGLAAALASAAMVPLAHVSGSSWPWALGALMVLPLAALLVWMPQLRSHTAPASNTAIPPHGGRVWHSALAWQVALFLGLNSFIYYVVIGWLPAILAATGYSAAEAGTLHGLLQLATAIPGLVLGIAVRRTRDQRGLAIGVSLLTATSLAGLLWFPSFAMLWALLFGFGTGATFILGLTFVSLRTNNAHQTAALSGMAQCIGYLLAAVGPPSVGALYDAYTSWSIPLVGCALLSIAMAWMGSLAGRAIQIKPAPSVN